MTCFKLLVVICNVLSLFGQGLGLCPKGWYSYRDKCYHVNQSPATWIQGMRMCELHGGKLLQIDSYSELLYVKSLLRHRYQSAADYWIGGTDWLIEGEWVWEPEGRIINVTDWYPGQPNNGNPGLLFGSQDHQNCISMRYSHTYKWVDSVCDEYLHTICQKHVATIVTYPTASITTTTQQTSTTTKSTTTSAPQTTSSTTTTMAPTTQTSTTTTKIIETEWPTTRTTLVPTTTSPTPRPTPTSPTLETTRSTATSTPETTTTTVMTTSTMTTSTETEPIVLIGRSL